MLETGHLYAPTTIDPQYCLENSCPLVFDFHGLNSNPEIQKSLSGFDDLSDEFGFIVVYPLGYENLHLHGIQDGAVVKQVRTV